MKQTINFYMGDDLMWWRVSPSGRFNVLYGWCSGKLNVMGGCEGVCANVMSGLMWWEVNEMVGWMR